MKLGLLPGKFSGRYDINMELVREAESLGFDSAWTSEAWGNDAITPATWILANTTKLKVGTAIIQMAARTPSMAAMTAMTLNDLSGGRFILGIGPSGPQVIEGWHVRENISRSSVTFLRVKHRLRTRGDTIRFLSTVTGRRVLVKR